jgi:polysaccharide biosynthesis transport protein
MASSPQVEESVDLRDYVGVLARRKWLILITTVICTGLAAAYSIRSTPVYTGFTEILVQPATTSATQYRPDQLVSLDTEARIVTSAPVATIAQAEVSLPISITELLERVTVMTTPETLVLDISFAAPDPTTAAKGANAFANAYLKFKTDSAELVLVTARKNIQTQISDFETQRDDLIEEIEGLNPNSIEYEDANDELTTIEDQITVANIQLASIPPFADPPGTVIVPATPPEAPSSPKHPLNLAMGLVIGLFLGIILAFGRDRLDDRVTERSDLESLGLTVFAGIPRAANVGSDSGRLVTEHQPRSPSAEAYRSLRTSIMAMARQSGDRVFAITSPLLGEGKSTTAANLASALSHADKRVLVISADLRRPSLHRFFGQSNEVGLTQILAGEADFSGASARISSTLTLVSSGPPAARPVELLQSSTMRTLIQRQRDHYDFIIIDCAPVLGIADTATLAPFVDTVILVARAEKSKRGQMGESMDQLSQVGASSQVAVINDVTITRGNRTYGYGAPEAAKGRRRSRKTGSASPAAAPIEPFNGSDDIAKARMLDDPTSAEDAP